MKKLLFVLIMFLVCLFVSQNSFGAKLNAYHGILTITNDDCNMKSYEYREMINDFGLDVVMKPINDNAFLGYTMHTIFKFDILNSSIKTDTIEDISFLYAPVTVSMFAKNPHGRPSNEYLKNHTMTIPYFDFPSGSNSLFYKIMGYGPHWPDSIFPDDAVFSFFKIGTNPDNIWGRTTSNTWCRRSGVNKDIYNIIFFLPSHGTENE